MGKPEHSPLPWKVRVSLTSKDQFFVQANRLKPSDPYDIEVLGEDTGELYPQEMRRADADFIVEACNNYERVVVELAAIKSERDSRKGKG